MYEPCNGKIRIGPDDTVLVLGRPVVFSLYKNSAVSDGIRKLCANPCEIHAMHLFSADRLRADQVDG